MAKMHHIYSDRVGHVPFTGRYVRYFCGMRGFTEILTPPTDEKELAPEDAAKLDHCKKCLRAKRRIKGDEFMIKHGYPLLDPRRLRG